jgi:hypothetical protein
MPVPDRDIARRPTVCPNGHQLGPGQFSLSWEWCGQPCGAVGKGHHFLTCNRCRAQLWLGHDGAEWERT